MENEDKKTIIIIIISFVVILIISIVVNSIIDNSKNKNRLEKEIKFVAATYYEDKFYSFYNDTNIISKFVSTGINYNAYDFISSYANDTKIIISLAKKNKCDLDKSKVSIYPTSPFGKKDYSIVLELDCD